MKRKYLYTRRHTDYLLVACVWLLVLFGVAMLASASSNLGEVRFNDPFYYLTHQALYGLSLGAVGFFLGLKIPYRVYERFALPILLVSLILLSLVFTPLGIDAKGASRWVAIGPVSFQPSEIAKIAVVLYLAAWLSKQRERSRSFWNGAVPFSIILAVVAVLLLKQPATSTVVILLATAFAMYFISGAKMRHIASLAVVGVALLAVVIYFTPYRFERILTFLEPQRDTQSSGYHLTQSLIAIGSGGVAGVGYGQSTSKLSYLPEPIGDSIFAVVAEETGFIGATALIVLFGVLVVRMGLLARASKSTFGQLTLIGFATLIGVQTFINIAAISGLIPLTGTPLPFVSYGGTSLAVFMTMGGIAAHLSRHG